LQGTRGQVTIGTLEYWNDGVMGFGKTGKWVIDKIYLDRIVKKKS
jgi:hypothetical protein